MILFNGKTKILFLCLIFIFSLTISSANQNVTLDDNLSNDVSLQSNLNESLISQSDVGNFKDLSNIVNNGDSSIKLSKNYEAGDDESQVLISNSNLIIDGQGHTVDAKNNYRIFYIDNDVSNIVFKNLIFINSKNHDGGALYFNDSVRNLVIENCSFKDNFADNGGAIYFNGVVSNLTIDGSSFISNSATYNGGAIYFNNDVTDISVRNVIANNNKGITDVNSYGGVLFFNSKLTNLLIDNSSFDNNMVYHSGGALWIRNAALNVKIFNSNFTKNKAGSKTNGGSKDYRGGSIFFNAAVSELYMINDAFDNNHVEARRHSYGGAIFFNGAVTDGIIDSKFINNYAQPRDTSYDQSTYGGAIFFNGGVSKLKIYGYFKNNGVYATGGGYTESVYGGALYIKSITGSVINASFDSNYAKTSGSTRNGYGGAIYINTASDSVITGTFYNNYATGLTPQGGAIYMSGNCKNVEIYNATFYDNIASEGGAIFILGNLNNIYDSLFESNEASNGGAIYASGTLKISNNHFISNLATNGSSIYCNVNSDLKNNIFMKSDYGGNNNIIEGYVYANVKLDLTNNTSTFTDFKIILDNAVDVVDLNCNYRYFENYDSFSQNPFEISKSLIINGNGNIIDANYNAMRIFKISANDVVLNNITFKNSRLNDAGNAVLAEFPIIINYCTFENNWALDCLGGALNLKGDNSYVTNSVFINNKALAGAAIIVNSEDNHILYSYFNDNEMWDTNNINYGSDIFINDYASAHVNYNIFLDYHPLSQADSETSYYDNYYGDNTWPDSSISGAPNIPNYLMVNFDAKSLGKSDNGYSYDFKVIFTRLNTGEVVDIPFVPINYTVYNEVTSYSFLNGNNITFNSILPLSKVSVNLGELIFSKNFQDILETGTFTELNNIISSVDVGGTINLIRDFKYDSNVDDGTISISKTLTINGNNHIIDADSLIRIFIVSADNVVLRNITLVNGNSINGGAVRWLGNDGVLEYVNFTNCKSPGWSGGTTGEAGGGISWKGNNGVINHCYFNGCNAQGGGGASVHWSGKNGIINNTEINDSLMINWPYSYGGNNGAFAICWTGTEGQLLNTKITNPKKTGYNNRPYAVDFVNGDCWIDNLIITGQNDGYSIYTPKMPVEDNIGIINVNLPIYKYTPNITCENGIFTINSVKSGIVTYIIDDDIAKNVSVDENGHFIIDYPFNPSQKYLVKITYNQNIFYNVAYSYFDYSIDDIKSGEFATFSDLNEVINGNSDRVINLYNNYVFNSLTDSAFADGISISRTLTINGNNHYIDADYNSIRIFKVLASNVVLNNITFKNSRLNSPGNAVLANSAINITYCTFDNNWALNCFGAAVNLNGGNSYVKYCTFTNNKALTGAAIIVNSMNNYILYSYFKDNEKDYGGNMNYGSDISITGGKTAYVNYNIFLDYRPLRQVSSEYSRNNWYGSNSLPDSSASGAPIISNYLKANLNYEFKNNRLTLSISFTESDTGNIVDVKWANKVIYTIGSVSLISDTLTPLEYSTTSSNVAINAVIDNQRLTNTQGKSWYVKTTGSDRNSGTESSPYKTLKKAINSASNGDTIYVAPGTYTGTSNVKLTISKSLTIERWGDSGEVIFNAQNYYTIFTLNSNVILSSLTFKNAKASNGGALVIKSDSMIIDCTFMDNEASSWGGAIDMDSGGATIINSRFINNKASSGGGAISTAGVNLTVFNCTFINNNGGRGGAINSGNIQAKLNIIDSTFKHNSADSYGGALIFDGEGNILDSLFINNSASLGGGAVYFWGYNHKISNSEFINNSATDGGAVIALYTTLTSLNNCFTNNIGYGFGGAVYGSNGDFIINDDVFSNNIAYYDGGAVYIYKGIGSIYESLFKRNVAGYGGGAVHLLASDLFCVRMGMLYNITSCLNGYVNTLYLNSFIDYGNYTLVVADTSNYNGILPSYFSLVDNGWDTAVKNQGSLGICWDYAVIATVESAIKKATGVEVDLSENNVKNLISMYSIYGNGRNPNDGGYVWDALSYLANSLGPVYENIDTVSSYGFSPLLSNVYHISNIAFATRSRDSPLDNDDVKLAVIKYGGVRVSINMDDEHKGYNYYHSSNTGTNHAIMIVGWDDNYSASNFPSGCPGDGAWIVKNSWGASSGKNGYIYVSYYDQTFAWDGLSYIIFNDTIRYSRVYQYDYSNYAMKSSGSSVSWYKNIYTSVKNEGLTAFSTYFNDKTDWEVFVYVGDELKHTQTGSSISAGYFTFNFDKVIPVAEGDQFTIVLKVNKNTLPYVSKNLNTLTCGAGVSYYSKDGVNWIDLDKDNQVACLKVFTLNMPGSLVIVNSIVNVTYNSPVTVEFNVLNRTVVNYILKKESEIIAEISNISGNDLILNNLAAGNYSITIINENNENYIGNQKTVNFTVNKANSLITLNNIGNKVYGNNFSIDFDVVNQTILNYTLKTKNGLIILDGILNNTKSITVPVFDAGDYIIIINNSENENYTGDIKSQEFTIIKANSTININDFNYNWDNGSVNIDYTGAANVHVFVQDYSEAIVTVINKKISISNLSSGTYTLNVTTEPDKNHNSVSKTVKFIVNAIPSVLNNIDDIMFNYGDYGEMNVSYSGAIGVNAVIIDHDEAKIQIKGNKIIVSNLSSGTYTLNISTISDNNHTSVFKTATVKINKINPDLTITVTDAIYSDNVSITVKSKLDGIYNIDINGTSCSINVVDGVGYGSVKKSAGIYNASVSLAETTNYKASGDYCIFKVLQNNTYNFNVVLNQTTSNYGEPVEINSICDVEEDGIIIFTDLSNANVLGQMSINSKFLLPKLDAGFYQINASYSGSRNYASKWVILNLIVKPIVDDMRISVTDYTYGANTIVKASADYNVSGKVTYYIADRIIAVSNIDDDGFILTGLSAGEYTIKAVYSGNINYQFKNNTFKLNVKPANSTLNTDDLIVTYPNPIILSPKAQNATGISYILYHDDAEIKKAEIGLNEDIILNELPAGEYIISLKTKVDENHSSTTKECKITILNGTINLTLNISNITYPNNLTFKVKTNVTGKYIISIVEVNLYKEISLTAGKEEIFDIGVQSVGKYTVQIISCVDNYDVASVQREIDVLNGTIDLKVNVDSIIYDIGKASQATVNVSVGGNYRLVIDGKYNVIKVLSEGVNVIDGLPILDVGVYNLTVTSLVDNYNAVTACCEFVVSEGLIDLSLEAEDVIYPNNLTFKVKTNVTGKYIISIAEVNLKVETTLTTHVLEKFSYEFGTGSYTIKISCTDKNYKSISISKTVQIFKADPDLSITVTNSTYPDNVTITVKSKLDAKYTVAINGTDYNVDVVGGNGTISIKKSAGIYNASVSLAETTNYNSSENYCIFNVAQNTIYNFNVSPNQKTGIYGDDIEIVTQCDADENIKVIFTDLNSNRVLGEGDINSKYILPVLNAGNYLINASYGGSSNYALKWSILNITIIPIVGEMNISALNYTYGGNTTIKANAYYSNVNGKVSYYIDGEKIGEDNINGNGFILSNLDAGEYTVKAVYSDDVNYKFNDSTFKVTVKSAPSLVCSSNCEFVYGSDISISVKSQNATNILYYLYDSNGVMIKNNMVDVNEDIRLSKLDVGEYTINLTTLTDKNHASISKTYFLKISNASINIQLDITDTTYPNNPTLKIKTDVSGNYKIEIATKIIEINLTANNETLITLEKMPADDYTVIITSNIPNYGKTSKQKTFKVNKAAANLTFEVKSIKINQNQTVYIHISDSATGTITVTLDNQTKTLNLKKPERYVSFDNLGEGNHIITVTYNGDGNYNASLPIKKSFLVTGYTAKDLKNEINNAISKNQPLNLIHDYVFTDNDTIVISKPIVINANGYRIDANGFSNIFNITSDNVTLNNLTLTNAKNSAINWFGNNGTLNNSVLFNNSAVDGGAIKWIGNNANILNSKFINNTAENEGGSIIIYGNNSYIENTIIKDNKAAMGAGISFKNKNMIIVNSTFYNNNANSHISGIAVDYDSNVEVDLQTKKNSDATIDLKQTQISLSSININGEDVEINLNITSNNHKISEGNVSVVINSKKYTSKVSDGKAIINIKKLPSGKYDKIIIAYDGSDYYGFNTTKISFEISIRALKIIENKNINSYYMQQGKYSIRIVDINNNPVAKADVKFKLNGNEFNLKTDKNGYSGLSIKLNPGTYTISAQINGYKVSNKIVIKHIITAKKITKIKKSTKKTLIKITVKGHIIKQSANVKFTYKGKNKIKVKFTKAMKKQTVFVKFKGKTYKVKVDKKGKGTIKVSKKLARKLKKNVKYNLKVTYKGSKLYKKIKLTVKFNGKKYKVKTNKNGIAKFKITKKMVKQLKKGKKYKYFIYYKKDTVKRYVKIK